MRAIIRVILPDTTDKKAIEVKGIIEKALKEETVEREVELNLMSR